MRRCLILVLLCGCAQAAFPSRQITVAELEQMLAAGHRHDTALAKKLAGVELTERLTTARLERLEAALPGPNARVALLAVADPSAFLHLPPGDLPALPPPAPEAERRAIVLARHFAEEAMRQLPNLFATRATQSFINHLRWAGADAAHPVAIPYQPMRYTGIVASTVVYRDGAEVQTRESGHNDRLKTIGEFGPMLRTVLSDTGVHPFTFERWEQTAHGPAMIFTYSVPRADSHYAPAYCCVDGRTYVEHIGYHGELAVDPGSGAVLRLTLQSEIQLGAPIAVTNTFVEYGPVLLGGKTYICPLRSVTINQIAPSDWPMLLATAPLAGIELRSSALLQTLLNDTTFEDYHLFHAEVRMLPPS